MARNRSTRGRSTGNGDDAAKLALLALLVLAGTGRVLCAWLAVWWPVLALAGAVVVVLLTWRVLVLRRRARGRAARQARLDQQVAATDGMSGADFEQLVARLLRRDGWRQVTVSGGSGDLGADVTARHPGDGSLLVVQCKRYTDRAVGSPDLQRFLGTVFHHHRADHALYVTTSTYSRPARALAAGSGVQLLDREALATWMTGRSPALDVAVQAVAR